ncbi:MAG: patatin-like phospholipase family protein [Clostridia bacterium]|nr:patatin-like phospholipase family protein [Clostridia bacterium]
MKKLGLALGAGGSRGVAHIGFIKALEENGIRPDYIAGCSMGAVIGACYANGMTALEMREEALKLRAGDIIDVSLAFITRLSVLQSKKVSKLITKLLGDKNIEDLSIPFKCVATDVTNGQVRVFDHGSAAQAVLASSAIPCVFRPVQYDGSIFVDGGCLCRVPVGTVKEMGADVVIAVDVLKNTQEEVDEIKNILALILRVYDVMDTQMTLRTRVLERKICDLLIEPEMKGMSQYAIKDLDKAYDEGYAEGIAHMNEIKALLAD